MVDLIVVMIILMLVVSAVWYIVKQKKKGSACIGCPNASSCEKNCHCNK